MKNKKVVYLVLALFLVFSFSSTAEENDVWWGSWYSPGNLAFSVRGAYETPSGYSAGVGIYPGAELLLYKPSYESIAPFDFGLAARGHIGIGFDNSLDNSLSAGIGALATFHIGFRGIEFIDPAIMAKLDYFAEVGLGFNLMNYNDDDDNLVFCTLTGVNYFVNPTVSLSAGYNKWGTVSGAFIGLQLRFGPSPDISELVIETPSGSMAAPGKIMMAQMYVSQFYAIYWYAFAAGGFYFDDSTYEEGEGTVWALTSSDEKDELLIEKALLKKNADGSRWWRVAFTSDGDRFVYEYRVAPDFTLLEMKFKDVGENKVGEYTFKEGEGAQYGSASVQPITSDDYGQYRTGSQKITVQGGTFSTDLLEYGFVSGEDSWSYKWWVSKDVPGGLVKFVWEMNDRKDWMQGELVELTTGNKAELLN